jgi:predicted PurR-regulated permease PerM
MAQSPTSRFLLGLQAVVLIVAALYFAQPVLLPLVAATLLTFLLRPSVLWLERHRVPRALAVVIMAVGILLLITSVGWVVTRQLNDLALHLDEYRGNMRAKIETVQHSKTKAFDNVRGVIVEVVDAVRGKSGRAGVPSTTRLDSTADRPLSSSAIGDDDAGQSAGTSQPEIVPVEPQIVATETPATSPVAVLRLVWESLASPLTMIAVVSVLVIFMLLEFEELRNRVLRLSGQSKLTLTTRTLDDVSRRISRYLLANAAVNGGFGFFVALGLSLIGVDYAALWGFLAAVLRFVPYVGPIAAATLAVGMAVLQFPDWTHPLLVVGLFIGLELLTNNVVEPLTYGRTVGVSTVALLVAATFWTWIWGPLGLVLSVPLTVVLAVLGKNIPEFESLGILLGDQPALSPHESFYQRLLAGDADEAATLLDEQLAAVGRATAYDRLIVPALALAERDRHNGELDDEDKSFVWHNAHELIEENAPPEENSASRRIRVATCPAQDLADEMALTMLQHLAPSECEVVLMSSGLMASEKTAAVTQLGPDVVVISALGPGGASQVRYLCKRIRHELPRVRIIVGRWGYQGDRERLAASLKARGVDYVVTTLQDALNLIERIQPLPMSA